MKPNETESPENLTTLEHLLGVVVANREKRCAEVRDRANAQASDIIRHAYARTRVRMHRQVVGLREKYRVRVSAALARNATLLRQQHQKEDRKTLDDAWPALIDAMGAQWQDPASRRQWLDAALSQAAEVLLGHDWRIEHPANLSEQELKKLRHALQDRDGRKPKLVSSEDIDAGIRISAQGAVVDATIEGLLHQKIAIEAELIARIKREAGRHE